MKTKQRGGKRKRAGRKPAADPKLTVTVYIPTSKVIAAGGIDKLKQSLLESVDA